MGSLEAAESGIRVVLTERLVPVPSINSTLAPRRRGDSGTAKARDEPSQREIRTVRLTCQATPSVSVPGAAETDAEAVAGSHGGVDGRQPAHKTSASGLREERSPK